MNSLLDEEDDGMQPRRDRELTLSTGTILGIFLGLVVICGLFFGFGYTLGQKSKTADLPTDATTRNADIGSTGSAQAKPSAGSYAAGSDNVTAPTSSPLPATVPPAHSATTDPAESANTSAAPVARTNTPQPVHVAPATAAVMPMPAISPGGAYVVQVAAVSHAEDANLLVGALRDKGYAVVARSDPNDRLIHIQVGPFASKSDAASMRDRLLGDGYNAIVK